jgi:hypothetical protein
VFWQDYLSFLQHFAGRDFPTCDQLNALLPDGLNTANGQAIRFVASSRCDDGAYEHRIYTSGQISTRTDNWHDLFNALVWMRFPHIKTAMNSLHFHAAKQAENGSRGPLRDALTLFDECGVIVFSNNMESLHSLAQSRWTRVFQTDFFNALAHPAICGHALLEKYLSPYKAMTAKALLVYVGKDLLAAPRQKQLALLDRRIAEKLRLGKLLTVPACLAPLPLAGIPGWWPNDRQDEAFYDDPQVFRTPPADRVPAPVLKL